MEPRTIISLIFILIVIFLIFKTKNKKNTSIPSSELRINLLPHYYKYVGIITAIASFISFAILDHLTTYNLKDFISLGIALGLSIICLSKEKIEDEMIKELRMNTFFKSFYMSLFAFLTYASINILVGGQLSELSPNLPIAILAITYLSAFHREKNLLANS